MNDVTVLLVDDEPNLRRVLGAVLEADGYRVISADCGRDALKKAKAESSLDLVITDYLMPDLNGLQVLDGIRKLHPGVKSLVVSGHGTVRSAVEAMRLGAFDYITKPFDVDQVKATVKRVLKADSPSPAVSAPAFATSRGSKNPATPPSDAMLLAAKSGLLGDSKVTRHLAENLVRAAKSNRATVLLLGESGTGKEVAAKLVHEASPRSAGPFVAVSCAALPDTLLESELFGHEKSAFTGAQTAKPGRFELAHGGTLFLDEIGDIPPLTQVKLLRALQEREICRIGGTKTVKVDVRLVAATNRDLWQAVQDGTFRLDLYYRLHVVPVHLPALRERGDDVMLLANAFLERIAAENGRAFPDGFAQDAEVALTKHRFPGNIRELQNFIEYAVVMASPDAKAISAEFLPPYMATSRGQSIAIGSGMAA
ncbi:MAG: sigma-54-dependent transcriptional regulator [Armatimonadota bacterium]